MIKKPWSLINSHNWETKICILILKGIVFRFIIEKCDGILVVENKKKKAIIEELLKRGYDSDPVKGWKIQQDRDSILVSWISELYYYSLSYIIVFKYVSNNMHFLFFCSCNLWSEGKCGIISCSRVDGNILCCYLSTSLVM